MIIDAHVHIGRDKDGNSQTIGRQKALMHRYGIDKSVIFPFDETGDLIEASRRILGYAGRAFVPFLRFDPKAITAEEVSALLSEGFGGVKLHPRAQNFDPLSRRYHKIYKAIEDSGKPLLMHTRKTLPFIRTAHMANPAYSDPDRIVRLAADFPNMSLIIAHLAAMSRDAITEIGRRDNLYLETSILGTTMSMKMLCKSIGADKIIYGSDAPYSDQEIEILKIRKAEISASEKRRILSENARKIIHI